MFHRVQRCANLFRWASFTLLDDFASQSGKVVNKFLRIILLEIDVKNAETLKLILDGVMSSLDTQSFQSKPKTVFEGLAEKS